MYKAILIFSIFIIFFPALSYSSSTVYGEVVDAETGAPIKDVIIFLVDGIRNTYYSNTDEKGEFYIYEVNPGICKIGFFPPAPYAWQMGKIEMEEFILDRSKNMCMKKVMFHGGTLELTLMDAATNTPLEDVSVNVIGASHGLQSRRYWQRTDKNGKYQMSQLMTGKYKLILIKDGWGMKVIPDVEVRLKETTLMTIQYNMPGSSFLTGFVKCEKTGDPLTNIVVDINRVDKYGWAHTYTDDKGQYRLIDIEPGWYRVKVFGLKDKIDDEEHTVYFEKKNQFSKGINPVVNFDVDCGLYFQKKWEFSWYEEQ